MKKTALAVLLATLAGSATGVAAQQASGPAREMVAIQSDTAPTIDGNADEAIWKQATAIVTHDPLAGIDLTLKAVYTTDSIFMLASFPDPDENRGHKTQIWLPDQERYRMGGEREDTFVFKWSMEPGPVNLRIDAEQPYKADIWYWKSNRTDSTGHADDKMHVYSMTRGQNAVDVVSQNGLQFFLARPGDSGRSAYKSLVHTEHTEDRLPSFLLRQPQGSRADVFAKGTWRDGLWTIEFRRRLVTNNSDDIQFDTNRTYLFGVSRYEIAGRKPNPNLQQPLFGAGEIADTLNLKFQTP